MNTDLVTDDGPYLEPSPRLRELQLMELLADQPETSQSALADLVGLTPARVNAYIRRFLEREYIETEQKARGMAYHLTALGRRRLAYHQVTYRAELVRLTRAARQRMRRFFSELRAQGIRRIVLYGAGETAEVVLDALAGTEVVTVLAVLDDDPAKQGRLCHGVPIQHRCVLPRLAPDGVVITSVAFGDAIREQLATAAPAGLPVFSLAS